MSWRLDIQNFNQRT